MEPQLSFPDGQAQKDRLLAAYHRHIAADTLIRGTYGDPDDAVFRGCAVGCALHELDPSASPSDHEALGRVLGSAEVARLLDRYFERVSPHQQTALRIVEAIPVGADLSLVGWQHGAWCLRKAQGLYSGQVADAIGGVAALFERAARSDMPSEQEWRAAAYDADASAYAYARAADYAADYGAARAARAAAAAYAAAASASASAAYAYASAATGLEHFIGLLKSAHPVTA